MKSLLECADLTSTPAGLPVWGPRCQRFSRLRLVAALVRRGQSREGRGVKTPYTKAAQSSWAINSDGPLNASENRRGE